MHKFMIKKLNNLTLENQVYLINWTKGVGVNKCLNTWLPC